MFKAEKEIALSVFGGTSGGRNFIGLAEFLRIFSKSNGKKYFGLVVGVARFKRIFSFGLVGK